MRQAKLSRSDGLNRASIYIELLFVAKRADSFKKIEWIENIFRPCQCRLCTDYFHRLFMTARFARFRVELNFMRLDALLRFRRAWRGDLKRREMTKLNNINRTELLQRRGRACEHESASNSKGPQTNSGRSRRALPEMPERHDGFGGSLGERDFQSSSRSLSSLPHNITPALHHSHILETFSPHNQGKNRAMRLGIGTLTIQFFQKSWMSGKKTVKLAHFSANNENALAVRMPSCIVSRFTPDEK